MCSALPELATQTKPFSWFDWRSKADGLARPWENGSGLHFATHAQNNLFKLVEAAPHLYIERHFPLLRLLFITYPIIKKSDVVEKKFHMSVVTKTLHLYLDRQASWLWRCDHDITVKQQPQVSNTIH